VCWAYGQNLGARGRYNEALEQGYKGLEIAEEIEHQQWITACHFSLGMIHKDILSLEKARAHLEKAFQLAQQINSIMWYNTSLGQLAGLYAELGETQKAQHILGDDWGGDTEHLSTAKRICVWAQGELALALGKPAEALRLAERIIQIDTFLPEGEVIPVVWKLLSEALVALGRLKEAEVVLESASSKAVTYNDLPQAWRLYAGLAKLQKQLGMPTKAQIAFDQANEILVGLAEQIPSGELRENFLVRSGEMMGIE
jgi:tetratricopeptide (TPR) repeat protein